MVKASIFHFTSVAVSARDACITGSHLPFYSCRSTAPSPHFLHLSRLCTLLLDGQEREGKNRDEAVIHIVLILVSCEALQLSVERAAPKMQIASLPGIQFLFTKTGISRDSALWFAFLGRHSNARYLPLFLQSGFLYNDIINKLPSGLPRSSALFGGLVEHSKRRGPSLEIVTSRWGD